MKLIVWLWNPGFQYQKTRHNVWIMMLEKVLEDENLWKLKYDAKFNADVLVKSPLPPFEKGVIYAFPQTFMNLSWSAVESLMRYYQISMSDLLVLHDEIELPFGKIVKKSWWWTAGHNGLKSIVSKLGNGDFQRIRIWVWKSDKIWVAEYVLKNFLAEELDELEMKKWEIFEMIWDFMKN